MAIRKVCARVEQIGWPAIYEIGSSFSPAVTIESNFRITQVHPALFLTLLNGRPSATPKNRGFIYLTLSGAFPSHEKAVNADKA